MEDAYYYKLASIAADLQWMSKELKSNNFEKLFTSEGTRKKARTLLGEIGRDAKYIQSKAGEEFHTEFETQNSQPPIKG